MNKIDSAFDIDPLFHKMSKTFDEGGAKGMLLANLSVAPDGPQIVFDSKADSIEEEMKTGLGALADANNDPTPTPTRPVLDQAINISGLHKKLNSLLGDMSLSDLPLVPQLDSLRQEYAELQSGGFMGAAAVAAASNKYER